MQVPDNYSRSTPSAVTVTTSLTASTAIIDEVTIPENNITTNATNADLVLVPNGTGTVRTVPYS